LSPHLTSHIFIQNSLTRSPRTISFSFFNHPRTTELYTLSLHDALPISFGRWASRPCQRGRVHKDCLGMLGRDAAARRPYLLLFADRKSTRLNSSHVAISYAVFCLKKKKIGDVRRLQQRVVTVDV